MSKSMLVVLALVALGGVYGYFSGVYNVNPNPLPAADDPNARAARQVFGEWSPSPVWLPAYLVATVPHRVVTPAAPKNGPAVVGKDLDIIGYGLENRADVGKDHQGWAFPSSMRKMHYRLASMVVGAGMGLVVAIILSVCLGWITLRKPKKDPAEEPKPKKPYTTWP